MGIDVRPATRADVPALADVLGRAFVDDPLLTWLMPDDEFRTNHIVDFFAALTRTAHLGAGGNDVALYDEHLRTPGDLPGTRIGAAALWFPPRTWKKDTLSTSYRRPGLLRVFTGRPSYLARCSAVAAEMSVPHPAHPAHWYLSVLGTDPPARGLGLATALLRSGLERFDADGTPAYFEASQEAHVRFYEQFGFEVLEDYRLSGGGPRMWAMWRDPQ